MTDERIQSILAKQATAAERKRRDEQSRAQAAEVAAKRRQEVEQLWIAHSQLLGAEITELNALMAPNDVQLHRRMDYGSRVGHLEQVDIGFEPQWRGGDLQHLTISVAPNGNVDVNMGTRNHWPEKSDKFTLEEGSAERWRKYLLDFVEINTPGA